MADSGASPCRVVLCDDAVDFMRLVKLLFDVEDGVEVVGLAQNGLEAVELCRELQPDVLLLDVSMPVMDGLTALPKVLEASPETSVVMLSGLSSPDVHRRALELGAAAFVEKGTSALTLPQQVRRHC